MPNGNIALLLDPTFPVIFGWTEQKYGCSRLGKCVRKLFVRIPHVGLGYAVCAHDRVGNIARLIQVTVVPTETLSVSGPKLKLCRF